MDQNYPKEDYEIIVVNDGSIDNTKNIVESFPVRLVDLEKNQGRLLAREMGARNAKYDNLFFMDSRCRALPNILNVLNRLGEDAVAGDVLRDKRRGTLSHFFYLLRKKYYGRYFNASFEPFYINKENFNRVPKGTGVFFCKKDLFLSGQPMEKKKDVSDDTRLFYNILNMRGKILKHPKILVQYQERNKLNESISHIHNRGKKFSDFYLRKDGKYYKKFLVSNAFLSLFIFLSIIYWPIFIMGIITLIGLYFLIPLFFIEEKGDYLVMLRYQGLIGLSFISGVFVSKKETYITLILMSLAIGILFGFVLY